MTYSAVPQPMNTQDGPKKPGKFWIRMESFLTTIGLLHPVEKPFKEMVNNVLVEQGGRRLIRTEERKMRKPRVLNMPHEGVNEISIATPLNINQAAAPADMLRSGRSILCNFHGIEKRNLEQVRFFLMGVVYAIGGTCKKVNDTIYLFTPPVTSIVPMENEEPVPKKIHKEKNMGDEEVLDQFFGT